MRIYVCSPYRASTKKALDRNVEFAQRCCREVFDCGHAPVAPHLFYTQFLDESNPEERARGLFAAKLDLLDCDQVWVFGNRVSEGMAGEIALAKESGIPVVHPDFVKLRGEEP